MIRSAAVLFVIVAFVGAAAAQKVFVNKPYGFAMEEPKGWIATDKSALTENLKKFEMEDADLERLLKENSGSILLAAYTKYSPSKKAGLIPTIQVSVRSKPPLPYERFSRSIVQSVERMNQTFEEFEFIGAPQDVDISGIRSVFMMARFTMASRAGKLMKIRSRMFAIPLEKYFFQVNFTDGFGNEDCTEEFERWVKTIKIGREALSQAK